MKMFVLNVKFKIINFNSFYKINKLINTLLTGNE
jgi:hypothetical protein